MHISTVELTVWNVAIKCGNVFSHQIKYSSESVFIVFKNSPALQIAHNQCPTVHNAHLLLLFSHAPWWLSDEICKMQHNGRAGIHDAMQKAHSHTCNCLSKSELLLVLGWRPFLTKSAMSQLWLWTQQPSRLQYASLVHA